MAIRHHEIELSAGEMQELGAGKRVTLKIEGNISVGLQADAEPPRIPQPIKKAKNREEDRGGD